MTVPADGQISGGAWVEHIKVDGCTTSGIFNVLTFVRTGSEPTIEGLLPGTTRAPSSLQRDALPTARGLALTKLPQGCADVRTIDTTFQDFGAVVNHDVPSEREARSWSEKWTFSGCGQEAAVTVRFIPDQSGTSFTASF